MMTSFDHHSGVFSEVGRSIGRDSALAALGRISNAPAVIIPTEESKADVGTDPWYYSLI
jgi:hypothetical protein